MLPTRPWEQMQTDRGRLFFPLMLENQTQGARPPTPDVRNDYGKGRLSVDPSRERMLSEPMKENKDPKSPLKLGEQ